MDWERFETMKMIEVENSNTGDDKEKKEEKKEEEKQGLVQDAAA